MRLHRVSMHYRRAYRWAELILRGMGRPVAGGGLPPFVIDANHAFEAFAAYLARTAAKRLNPAWRTAKEDLPRKMLVEGRSGRPDITIRDDLGIVAVGDAKYKDVLDWAAAEAADLGDPVQVAKAAIRPADWNQLYVYMRLAGARRGFFIVPYWSRLGNDANNPVTRPEFALGPLDHGQEARIAVFGVNLMRRVAVIKNSFIEDFQSWLRAS